MTLLQFAKETSEKLKLINDNSFAIHFVKAKQTCFNKYQNWYISSNSHGISFFDNIIKFWDNPDSYYTPLDKKGNPIDISKKEILRDDYEYNFIRILKINKEASPEVINFLSQNETTHCESETIEGNIKRWTIITKEGKNKFTFEHPII